MDYEEYAVSRFDGAVLLLPYGLRERARRLRRAERAVCEEVRLRLGRVPTALLPRGEVSLGGDPVAARDLENVMELLTGASLHAVEDRLRAGFLTARGGYRVGVCGTVTLREGRAAGFAGVSSLNIRISREVIGAAEGLYPLVTEGGRVLSTLLIAPPGGGKTTLLRDLVRLVSDGGTRVGLVDERGELAAFYEGTPQCDVGARTDVLDGCPKAEGITMLLRAMNPEVIAVDEVTSPEDAEALIRAAHCGAALLATAHAESREELTRRPVYRALMEAGIFTRLAVIRRTLLGREVEVKAL